VNVLGSFAIGILASFAVAEGRTALTPSMRQFLMAGVCGGFTTFSAFSLQTLELLQHRHWLAASGNIALSLILCLVAVAIGFGLGSMLNARAA
ncbi:MAG TPA: CrcB family protein, partial [Verrucomicrobiae bacterium]|nr:CrcB family protein [Verrucomicrobiae bacterium]